MIIIMHGIVHRELLEISVLCTYQEEHESFRTKVIEDMTQISKKDGTPQLKHDDLVVMVKDTSSLTIIE